LALMNDTILARLYDTIYFSYPFLALMNDILALLYDTTLFFLISFWRLCLPPCCVKPSWAGLGIKQSC